MYAGIGPGLFCPQKHKYAKGLSEDIRDIAWDAQLRLCHRYRRLIAKGKKHNVAIICYGGHAVSSIEIGPGRNAEL